MECEIGFSLKKSEIEINLTTSGELITHVYTEAELIAA